MDWKKLVSIAISLFFVSCISFYHHPKGGFRPKKPKFSLAKEKFIFNNLIDTTAIYVNIDTLKVEDLKSVFFFKFYDDGRCFLKSIRVNKKLNNNNLYPGFIGYYKLNKNKVTINFFDVNIRKKTSEYIIQKGFIRKDTIFLRNNVDTTYIETYVKQKLDFIPEPSNW